MSTAGRDKTRYGKWVPAPTRQILRSRRHGLTELPERSAVRFPAKLAVYADAFQDPE